MSGTHRDGAASMSILSRQGKPLGVINNLIGNIEKIRLDTILGKDFDGDVLV